MALMDQIEAGETLLEYARDNRIDLPAAAVAVLRAARGQATSIAAPGPDRDAFLAALDAVVRAVPLPVSALRAAASRRKRLIPLVSDAQSLLDYAAANAKKIDDENRKVLVASSDAVLRGTPGVQDEQDFLRSYEQLTLATAPVTAETLDASETRLPTLRQLFSKSGFWAGWEGLTLGRFVDTLVFIAVLLITCLGLRYHSVGSDSLRRLNELDSLIAAARAESNTNADVATLKQIALTEAQKAEKAASAPAAVEAARSALLDAQRKLVASQAVVAGLKEERDAIPSRLWRWSQLPCGAVLVSWALCSSVDTVAQGTQPASDLAKVAAAQTTVKWMNEIVLPLLLGWVGAYAFVIRGMTAEISQRSFAKSSTLRHIARLSLGALAGIASGWLFAPEVVSSQLKNVPAWVLAFVAGYGIELVFAFLDRVIGAFSTKTA